MYSSALAKMSEPFTPPATKTWPLGSSVAVALSLAVISEPVGPKVPVAGLYSSGIVTRPEFSVSAYDQEFAIGQ